MEQKQKEQENQFTVWMTASILLHLLIILVAFFWYLELSLRHHFLKKKTTPQQEKEQALFAQKPKQKEEPLIYTLIPGRKAITESKQTKEDKVIDRPEPEQKHIEKKTEKPIPLDPLPVKSKKNIALPQHQPKRHDEIKRQLLQKPQDHLEEEKVEKTDISETKDPTITKKKVSLQDLKLGFAKFLNEGNNDILLQNGNTNDTPDAQSLRLITYNQQIARTMKEAILTHFQYDQLKDIRGKKILLTITLERNGKLVNLTIIQPSGHTLLDKVAQESLKEIKLYPQVPKHIPQDPYTMKWNLLF